MLEAATSMGDCIRPLIVHIKPWMSLQLVHLCALPACC